MSTVTIHVGSNLDVLPSIQENSVDAIVSDPPYELGFMGKSWDSSGIAYSVELWKQCLRVLKPGGHLLAFSGSRTYHRMTCAIEDAGFEVRDQIMWVYGSGFPKSHNVGKALDKATGAEREVIGIQKNAMSGWSSDGKTKFIDRPITAPYTEAAKRWDGWGTALKPAHEPICVARKPLEGTVADNVMKWGTGAINVDGCRVGCEMGDKSKFPVGHVHKGNVYSLGSWGKPRTEDPNMTGRWPANLIHDGSQEVLELFPHTKSGTLMPHHKKTTDGSPNGIYGKFNPEHPFPETYGDSGSAARFFYCPKASKKDRDDGCEGMEERRESDREKDDGVGGDNPRNRTNEPRRNFHPTVKPTDLMRYLCRLVTPPGGTVLDPFMGSGSTGRGAVLEGFDFIGVELSDEYAAIAKARIDAALRK